MQEVVNTLLASLERRAASLAGAPVTAIPRVTEVELELGVSGHFTEEAVRQYFQALTQNTPAEGATLTLAWLPATYQCLSCLHQFESTSSLATCPQCGDIALEISHRDECSIRSFCILEMDREETDL